MAGFTIETTRLDDLQTLHIEDVDPEDVRNERYRSHSGGGSSAEEDLAPGHVVVSAAVMLGFALA